MPCTAAALRAWLRSGQFALTPRAGGGGGTGYEEWVIRVPRVCGWEAEGSIWRLAVGSSMIQACLRRRKWVSDQVCGFQGLCFVLLQESPDMTQGVLLYSPSLCLSDGAPV